MKTARMLVILVLALALVVGLCGKSRAAPLGTAFMYQNLLIDGNDVLDGSYDLMVSLFDDPNEDDLRGTVFADDLDVNDGWFEIMLDFGPEAFDGSDLWLEFAARPGEMDDPNAYVTLWPRYPILPAPYALYSINTGPIHSLDAADGYPTDVVYVDDSGDVGIGTKRPGAELDVDGKVRIRGGSPGNGKVLTSDDRGLASWETPTETDPVYGASPAAGIAAWDITNWIAAYGWGDHSIVGYLTGESDPQVGANTTNYVPKWDGSALVIGTIYDNGDVGIGTSSPGAKLEVNGQVKITGGSPGADKVLTSDSSGLASWQTTSGSALPSGVIVMWSGGSIPTGWALCNGSNGTPNLTDRFVVGAGSNYSRGDTGGSETHYHSVSLPNNAHSEPRGGDGVRSGGYSTSAVSTLPPYYALAYIMKL